jgi:hypothetical protein
MKSSEIVLAKVRSFIMHLATVVVCLFLNLYTIAGVQATFYVSPKGNDNNPGSMAQPFATIHHARDVVAALNMGMTGDIIIYLRGGVYKLDSTFILKSKDSGSNGHNIIYQAYNCETPVISGGMKVTGWVLHDTAKNIYKAIVDLSIDTRQLYVNGLRAVRARSMYASSWTENGDGYNCPTDVATWKNIKNVEVVSYKEWKCHRGQIDSMKSNIHAVMTQPYWKYLHKQYDAPPVWIENAYELLDSQGEWYLDRSMSALFYKPREGEDMSNAEVILPKLETLISGSGVSNVQFKGISFEHATWTLPNSKIGFACDQADAIFNGLNYERIQIPGNIVFDHSSNIRFENNTFKHLGIDALQLYIGCKNNCIYNNIFNDISGSAISIGEIIDPFPSSAVLVKDNVIDNNSIRDVAMEYKGCVGIFVGYTEHTTITHNEISHLPYTGISVGWGWSNTYTAGKNNEIAYNHIDSVMMVLNDGGGIYTLSSQPGAHFHDNYISNNFNLFASLYMDAGSSNMHWHHNVVRNQVSWYMIHDDYGAQYDTLENNYSDNQKHFSWGKPATIIRNNIFVLDGNWPDEALKIMRNARRTAIINKLTGISVTLNASVLHVNDSLKLDFNFTSCDSINSNVIWASSNPVVATVSSNGLVNANTIGNTTITVTSKDGSITDSLEVSVVSPTNIPDNLSIAGFIYPNPATDRLYIKNLHSPNAIIMVFDLQGNQILNKQISSGELDISSLSKGIFIVKLIDSGKVLIKKLIKE